MCGIAAIFAYHYAAPPVEREELARIRDRMHKRGPDGQGEWFSDDGRVALGHRRLAIIDLDERAAQPMVSACGRYRISFNGEIYNYRALRAELLRQGARLRTESDTEVLLALFARDGIRMLDQLRGMYAFVIHDVVTQTVWLARDPYGIKPLYYADDGWTLRAASQVKALLAGGRISPQREPAGQVGFLLWGTVPEPFTSYQAIRALPAGTWLRVDHLGAGEPERHFSISAAFAAVPEQSKLDDFLVEFRQALRESVAAHLIADVPVGAFLSGGLDSGSVVGMMAEQASAPIQAATILFERFRGSVNDESGPARELAQRFGVEHRVRVVSDKEVEQDLPLILDAMDQPTIDGINVWFAAKASHELGLRVAVSGVGGDELLAGYPSFRSMPVWRRWAYLPSRLPGLGRLMRYLTQPVFHRQRLLPARAAGLFEFAGSMAGAYLLRRGLFMPWELPGLLGEERTFEGMRRLLPLSRVEAALHPDPGQDYARIASLESALYLNNQLLRDCDWAAMAHSVEVRTPLVDASLLRRIAPGLRVFQKRIDKRVLATCTRTPLPEAVIHRPKTGFVSPTAHSVWQHLPSSQLAGARRPRVGSGQENPARSFATWLWETNVLGA